MTETNIKPSSAEQPIPKKRGRPKKQINTPEKPKKWERPDLRKYEKGKEPYILDNDSYRRDLRKTQAESGMLLPHLSQRKRYMWQKNYFESTNRMCLITAANQVGKSSIQIDKCIHWATEKKLWAHLWKSPPRQFWYLYPDWQTINTEVHSKWIPDHLPRGHFKSNRQWGWETLVDRKNIVGIKFRSGVTVWFRTYSQKTSALQASSVSAIFTDEELPEQHLPELQARMNFTDGYFSQVFTATLGQDIWYRAMECVGSEREMFREAFKQTVSLYDCLFYFDGQPSFDWTESKIEQIKARCANQNEIMRRVYGRFVSEEGLKYSSFDSGRHFVKPFPISKDFSLYAAIDPGSGGSQNHPASIIFLAVTPDCKRGYFYKGWRGDGVETTASDIMDKFIRLRGSDRLTLQSYDWSAKDFGIIASRIGEPFSKAEKSHELGEETLNTLFKNDALFIFDLPELQTLGTELASLRHKVRKVDAKDDYIDAARYACMLVPWNWDKIILQNLDDKKMITKNPELMSEEEFNLSEIDRRRRGRGEEPKEPEDNSWQEFDEECRFWNDQSGNPNDY